MTAQKIPFSVSINNFVTDRIKNNDALYGKILPCSVVAVDNVNAIVTIKFEVASGSLTIPQVTCAIAGSKYIRIPVQVGDFGICIPADTRLGGINGLGSGAAPLTLPTNFGAMVFMPIGNLQWSISDPSSIVLTPPTGNVKVTISPNNVTIDGEFDVTGNVNITGDLSASIIKAGNGASGTFTAQSGQTVTVVNGIVTSIV